MLWLYPVPPGMMHRFPVFGLLLKAEVIAPVRADGHYVGSPVAQEEDARARQRPPWSCDVQKSPDRVPHRLVPGRDPAGSRIIISPEMSGDTTPLAGPDDAHQRVLRPFIVHDDLRGFHHRFHLQRAGRQPVFFFNQLKTFYQGDDLFRDGDLRQHHHKIIRQPATGLFQRVC